MLSSLSELRRAGEGLYSEENTENETIDLRKKRKRNLLNTLKPYLIKQRSHPPSKMICQKNVNKCWNSYAQHNGNFTLFFILELFTQGFCAKTLLQIQAIVQ